MSDIRSLMQASRMAEASREIDRQLQKPDPEPGLQLLHCVVQANQNQTDKAIACLNSLVKTHPDMLEAYNNLGVLHASLGQQEEAKRWLTLAMQRTPSLWTVHQNLQTLQADLSRKAYARALQAELPLKEAHLRLTMLTTTALGNPVKMAQASTPVIPQPSPASPQTTKPETVKPLPPRPETVTASKTQAPKPEAEKTPKTEAVKTETAQSEPAKLNLVDEAARQQMQAAVESWAQAWSAQNTAAYFAAYAPDFTPLKSMPRANWEAERTSRIVGRRFIKVTVSNFSFEKKGGKTAVAFNQVYESDSIQSKQRKRLDLLQIDGRWKIVRETVISQ